jgi:ABC-type transporter Mla MlaB component
VVVVMNGGLARRDVARLCGSVEALLQSGDVEEVVCDVGRAKVDAAVVDALCRLQLTTLRAGRPLRVRNPSCELRILLALMGLGEILPGCGGLRVEARRQTEYGKQACGVEEERDAGDAAL